MLFLLILREYDSFKLLFTGRNNNFGTKTIKGALTLLKYFIHLKLEKIKNCNSCFDDYKIEDIFGLIKNKLNEL